MNMKIKLTIPLLTLLTATVWAQSPFSINTRLDSAHLVMGKQTQLHVEVVGPIKESSTITTIDTMWHKIEIASMGKPVLKDLGNNQRQLKQEITIQSFEPGLYTIPPFIFAQDSDTVTSGRPALKVLPVQADSLNNFENVVTVHGEFLPDGDDDSSNIFTWIILALLLIAGAIFAYIKWFKKGGIKLPLMPLKKPIPPYELAIKRLNELHEEHLCERGAEKIYYTRLTDILRNYLQGRFGINAMEMTSTQIMQAIESAEIAPGLYPQIDMTLRTADFVKFAKVKPTPTENDKTFKAVVSFVEQTRPEEPVAEDDQQKPANAISDKSELNQPK